MKITEDYVRKTIKEVAPLVEDLSGLKINLEYYWISLNNNLENDTLMAYNPIYKTFELKNKFKEGNEDYFKICVSHEIMHNAQHSTFPKIEAKRREDFIKYLNSGKLPKNNTPLNKLLEGDATLIQNMLNIKYFKKAKGNLFGIPLIPAISLINKEYDSWKEAIYNKFGTDRNKINKLYNSSLEDLAKVFE